MPKELTPEQALVKLEEQCAMAEICTGEAMEKLRRWGIDSRTAHEMVQGLIDRRFIDDERYARAFVRDRVRHSRWGRIKIAQALKLKQLECDVIDTALAEEVDADEYAATLASLLRAKARTLPQPLDFATRQKLMRFAAGRGFEPGLIMELMRDEDTRMADPAD